MKLLTLGEFAIMHRVSKSAVSKRLAAGRIPGAFKLKVTGQPIEIWQIPENAPYPTLPLGRPRIVK